MNNSSNSLPVKDTKVSTSAGQSKACKSKSKGAGGNPLGITVNTNLSDPTSKPPELVYAPTSNKQGQPTPALKKKSNPPKPLDLRACFTNGSSTTLPQQVPSSGQDIKTPIIIITPTQDSTDQDHHTAPPIPPVPPVRRPRIASSIYTVVSPVAKNLASYTGRSRAQNSITNAQTKPTPPSASVYSFKDRDFARRRRSTLTALPTPTRSSGWWNVITSPFASSGFAHSLSSSDSDGAEDETPLKESAAPMGLSRDIGDAHDNDLDHNVDLENSPFRHYTPPTTGEAAAYYDLNIDFGTPKLQSAGFDSPEIPMTARTIDSSSGEGDSNEREIPTVLSRHSPEVQDSAKKVPIPQLPSHPPPKSSRAAVIEDFRSHPKPVATPLIDTAAPSRQTIQSPLSPSPILETASIGTVQMARSIDAEQTRTPTQKPAVKIIAPYDKVLAQRSQAPAPFGRLAEDHNEPVTSAKDIAAPAAVAPPEPQQNPSIPAERSGPSTTEFYHDREHREASNITNSTQMFVMRQPDETSSRHVHTYSTESNKPLMFSKDSEKGEAQSITPIAAKKSPKVSKKGSRVEKFLLIGVAAVLAIIVIIAVLVCMLVARDTSTIPVAQHWLNLTGFPPLPTGVSTIARIQTSSSSSDCVSPPEMWSCAVPKQQRTFSNGPEPRFRFLILFNNATISDETLTQPTTTHARRSGVTSRHIRSVLRRIYPLRKRNIPAPMLYSYPSPPSDQDRSFLGNTTDVVTHPYEGEETPFFITFLPTVTARGPTHPELSKRAASSSTEYGLNLLNKIPPPSVRSDDGTASSPLLHPFPQAQPLRLYNRGHETEYYGFYTYFDKSIFLSSTGGASTNGDGGARISDADARCTWSQTRFLVKIWTRSGVAPSFAPSPNIGAKRLHVLGGVNGTVSAFDFSGSGSFPLPVSVVVDRHGGVAEKKGLYCYGVDSDGDVVTVQKALHREDRGFGGELVNPAPGPFTDADISDDDGAWGGVDGGSGGCSCEWTNFSTS